MTTQERLTAIKERCEKANPQQTSETFVRLRVDGYDPDDLPWLLGYIKDLERDTGLLKEQCRVADSAYNHLHSMWETIQTERNAALKLLGYDEAENDLLANIKRLKAYYEQELALCREGGGKLVAYAAGIQERLIEIDPNYCGHLTTEAGIIIAAAGRKLSVPEMPAKQA